MKPSHLRTPRTMGECHFQTGYKSADETTIRMWPILAGVAAVILATLALT